MTVTRDQIAAGLRGLGLDSSSAVIVHASLRSFGTVEGGPLDVCGTVLMTAATPAS
ncbi:hypothetical protein [Tenggerimyces flavus]|uniref:Aminoglycoside N(3)-acetyltransferase n=1 Tax=Tenggerimyces flavus TaxID=1708749 RepID=A0ABV7Y553_9ACTN|nr:hypothetical protein [Tenggerimyces flavus]MBM7788487.1 aminoglycoside N3'-acetyltransferase [Tenggerimyces flavus]